MADLLAGRAKVEEMDLGLILALEQMVSLLEGPRHAMILVEEVSVLVLTGDHLQGCRLKMSWAQMAFLAGRVPVTARDQDLAPMPSPMAGMTQETASLGEMGRKKNRAAGRAPMTWVVLARALTADHWVAMGLETSSDLKVFPSGGIQLTCKNLVPAAGGGQTWLTATGGDPTRRIQREICWAKTGGQHMEAGHLLRMTYTVLVAGPIPEMTFMEMVTMVRVAERSPIWLIATGGDPSRRIRGEICLAKMGSRHMEAGPTPETTFMLMVTMVSLAERSPKRVQNMD